MRFTTVLLCLTGGLLLAPMVRAHVRAAGDVPTPDASSPAPDAPALPGIAMALLFAPIARNPRGPLEPFPLWSIRVLFGLALTAMYRGRRGRRHREEAREVERLLNEHGASSIAWFALDEDTDYFWSRDRRAVLAYRPEPDALLVIGDPIGPSEALRPLLAEFESWCHSRQLPFAFFQARPELLPLYKSLGWRALHIGEDPVLWTDHDAIAGAPAANVRRLAREADTNGLQILHADPGADLTERGGFPSELRGEIAAVSREWARFRHEEQGFCLGRFDAPRLRQEWLAVAWDPTRHRIEAFATWVPVPARRGWALDVLRRRGDAHPGALELLVVRSLERARDRGDAMISLALSPLAFVPAHLEPGHRVPGNVESSYREPSRPHGSPEAARAFLQQHLARHYDFPGAFDWKRRFDPSFEDRYLVVPDPRVLPPVVLALIHAQGHEPAPPALEDSAGPDAEP
jgi:lysylphosphatidylglycerol synthetase-like protein (DUF2156 family)